MSTNPNASLEHRLSWYAKTYGIDLQNIQRARKRGWPLDDPKELYQRFLNSPGKTIRLQQLRDYIRGKPTRPRKTAPPVEAHAVSDELEHGLQSQLKRIKAETAAAYKAYKAERDPLSAAPRLKAWLALVAQMTQLAKIAPKADMDTKNSLPIYEVEAAWARACSELRSTVDGLPRRLASLPFFRKLDDPVTMEEIVHARTATGGPAMTPRERQLKKALRFASQPPRPLPPPPPTRADELLVKILRRVFKPRRSQSR
jgi:hypothetical protein